MTGPLDISMEKWRSYRFSDNGTLVEFIIDDPVNLWVGETTHRVQDITGQVHCLPTVGVHGCVVTWLPRDKAHPVQF